jgi:hypothetical protein
MRKNVAAYVDFDIHLSLLPLAGLHSFRRPAILHPAVSGGQAAIRGTFEDYAARGLEAFKEFAEIATGNRAPETYGSVEHEPARSQR